MMQTASRKTQAIFKISSYGKGTKYILNHLRYISRNGSLALEDQEGFAVSTLKEQAVLLNDWSVDFKEKGRSRDTMHLVLSTPPGTDRDAALRCAREFLEKEYKTLGHDYVFAAHNDTDHPHIHAAVKMVSRLGQKLNPRKAYLRQVRKDFAVICRSHGINVEASSRVERGLSGVSTRSEFVHMKRSGRQPKVNRHLIQKIKAEREVDDIFYHALSRKAAQINKTDKPSLPDKVFQDSAVYLAYLTAQKVQKFSEINRLKAGQPLTPASEALYLYAQKFKERDLYFKDRLSEQRARKSQRTMPSSLSLAKRFVHPSEKQRLKRNQIIRKRYVEKSALLLKHAQTLSKPAERFRYQKAAALLDDYAQCLPVEVDRGEKLHLQMDQRYGLPVSRKSVKNKGSAYQQSQHQYYAVTQGRKIKGVYYSALDLTSPKDKQAMKKAAVQAKEKLQAKEQDSGLELEL